MTSLGCIYIDILWASWCLKSLSTRLFVQQHSSWQKKSSKLPITGPTWEESTRHRIHWWLVDSPHKQPVMWSMYPCHNVIMLQHSHAPFLAICPISALVVSSQRLSCHPWNPLAMDRIIHDGYKHPFIMKTGAAKYNITTPLWGKSHVSFFYITVYSWYFWIIFLQIIH